MALKRGSGAVVFSVGAIAVAAMLWLRPPDRSKDSRAENQKPPEESTAYLGRANLSSAQSPHSSSPSSASARGPASQNPLPNDSSAPLALKGPTNFEEALSRLVRESSQPWKTDFSGMEPERGVRSLTRGRLKLAGSTNLERSQDFLSRYAQSLLAIPSGMLRVKTSDEGAIQRVVFNQFAEEIPVYGAQLSLFFDKSDLIEVKSNLYPGLAEAAFPAEADLVTLKGAANNITRELFQLVKGTLTDEPNFGPFERVYYPSQGKLVPAFETVASRGSAKPDFVLIIDAGSKRLIRWMSTRTDR